MIVMKTTLVNFLDDLHKRWGAIRLIHLDALLLFQGKLKPVVYVKCIHIMFT